MRGSQPTIAGEYQSNEKLECLVAFSRALLYPRPLVQGGDARETSRNDKKQKWEKQRGVKNNSAWNLKRTRNEKKTWDK